MIRLAITMFFVLMLTACGIGVGNNVILKEVYSADKLRKAILFLKENGATSDNSLQVSILSASDMLSRAEAGNAFTVDSDHNSTIQNENSISIQWIANDTLKIEYDKKLRTFIKESNVEDVTIIYEPK